MNQTSKIVESNWQDLPERMANHVLLDLVLKIANMEAYDQLS